MSNHPNYKIELSYVSDWTLFHKLHNLIYLRQKAERGRSCGACLKPVLIAGRNRPDELIVVGEGILFLERKNS
jgi:hypothetical protein